MRAGKIVGAHGVRLVTDRRVWPSEPGRCGIGRAAHAPTVRVGRRRAHAHPRRHFRRGAPFEPAAGAWSTGIQPSGSLASAPKKNSSISVRKILRASGSIGFKP